MPIIDYKVTDIERDGASVQVQRPDAMDADAAISKGWFDTYPDLLRANLDGLCDFLASSTHVYESAADASTAAKGAITDYVPVGSIIMLKMANGNTAASPTLTIDGVSHSISGMPTTAKLSTSNNQTYMLKRSTSNTLSFLQYPDYVCEYGTDADGWVYRRMASGLASANYIALAGSPNVTLANSIQIGALALYYRTTSGTNGVAHAMPNVFNALPQVFATFVGAAATLLSIFGYALGTNPYTANCQIITSTNASSGTAATVNFHAIGTWK